jgi:GT2 family glycosyltransferase
MTPYEYDLTIIVVAWNVKELLDECFTSLRKSDDTLKKQILLVDNGSVDGSADHVNAHYPEVEVIRSPTNLGFIRANNLAYKQAKGRFILMLNSDAFVSPTAIRETVQFLTDTPDAGVVGARLVGRDGVLQLSARSFPVPLKLFLQNLGLEGKVPMLDPLDDLTWDHKSVRPCDWVVGCYLLAKKEAIDRTGFFLREDYFMYNDDNDLCKRISKLGLRTYFYPVDVIHLGGANMKKMHKKTTPRAEVEELILESQLIYFRKNHGAGTAAIHAYFMILFDVLLLCKRLGQFQFEEIQKTLVPHMKMLTNLMVKTRFGARSIH